MKKNILITLLDTLLLTSCGEYNKLLKSTDYEYKYEAAKNYFAKGQYNRAATLLNELIAILKGTDKAEESLYMLGMSYYNQNDYQTAAQTFTQYYNVYPRGTFTELARFHAGKALYLDTPEPRLDQSGTYNAIQQLQMFLEYFPNSAKKDEAQNMIFALQDKLVMKEYLSAKLYYNLGNYLGNNYESCVITALNALKDYPYTNMREDLSILILRAKYEMAVFSVEEKREERYREPVDEYYAYLLEAAYRNLHDFHITYRLQRPIPEMAQVMPGIYIGPMYDGNQQLMNEAATVNLFWEKGQMNMTLDDKVILEDENGPGPQFYVDIAGLQVDKGRTPGSYVFTGEQSFTDRQYGPVEVRIREGRYNAAGTVAVWLEIVWNENVYELDFQKGVRQWDFQSLKVKSSEKTIILKK